MGQWTPQSPFPNHLPGRFSAAEPFEAAKMHAAQVGADVAVPNGPGLGDVLCFSRLVEDYARKEGRPIILLTGPMALKYGNHPRDGQYPVWENNPFVDHIIDADAIDQQIMKN